MIKYIIGFLIGVIVTTIISYDIIDTMKIEHRINLGYENAMNWHEGFKLGERYGKVLEEHKELMEKEITKWEC